jgi:hypothetical protein
VHRCADYPAYRVLNECLSMGRMIVLIALYQSIASSITSVIAGRHDAL